MKVHRRALALLALPVLLLPVMSGAQEPEKSYTISPNERIHIIQRKTNHLEGRWEATLYPVSAQLNSRWTEHLGFGVAGALHVSETLAVQAFFAYNGLLARETDLQNELREKARLQPPSAPSVLTQWYSVLAMEMSPVYGKIAFYKEAMMHFNLVLTAGVGIADSKVQLIPSPPADEPDARGPVFASAGLQGAGLLGAGFRVHIGENWLVRVEVRDLLYSARITKLNGCTKDDLLELTGASPSVGGSCNVDAFEGEFITLDAKRAADRADGSSETVNQVSAYVGFSYLF